MAALSNSEEDVHYRNDSMKYCKEIVSCCNQQMLGGWQVAYKSTEERKREREELVSYTCVRTLVLGA